ncbi:HAMP domain-containing histidine kinase [Deinococcus detaillensis]|uniref:histidine kinase n=1 Tax=Deinococcus detaillensis TaxID=2592048 RepID=A0A553UQC3_9DEIO|nr:HAMP domain-containing sensor histidine kinase [Deinococcus detaillensis]TSA82416.1 HAMP domain-containing histidine kinase [Deinococcus detaillensis]
MTDSARLRFLHTLRFRLALLYTLLALLVVGLVSALITAKLLSDLDTQFQARLDERADRLAEAFGSGSSGLGKPATPSGGYAMVVDSGGKVTYANAGVKVYENSPFPFGGKTEVLIQDLLVRTATRELRGYGDGKSFIWVGLPEDALVQARQSAWRLLWIAVLTAPALMMLLGWLVGRRALGGLGRAAQLADRIDPAQTVMPLPLPQQQDEVYRLLTAINRLLARIEMQQGREKQLLGQIVHELGAPLTVLRASLSQATQRTGDADVARAALVADELTFTTQDLMQLARGQLEMKLVWHFIPAGTLQGRLDRLVAGTTFSGDWQSGMVLCDPDRLTQALRNLLANARRAAGAAGWVEIDLSETPQQVRFTVRDSGPGLPSELGESIFDPFVSGSGSSGLGLSVSRQIAQAHGGELSGGNHPQGGAAFSLTLPGPELGDDFGDEDSAEWEEEGSSKAKPN